MNILVTGGAGFIGSHLCDRLMAHNHTVFCMDDLSTGSMYNLNFKSGLYLFKHDIVYDIYPVLKDFKIDQIYHLACPASPSKYQENPFKTMDTCYVGTANVLNLAKIKGAKVLFTSTSEVYGDPEVHPQPETYFGNVNTLGIRSCYDEGKRIAETLCYEYSRKGIDVKIARLFNTYGPRLAEGDGRVVSNFIVQALKGQPLTIYGDGRQTRSLCYVDDTVDGLITIMNEGSFGPYNLGTESEIQIRDLANMINQFTDNKAGVIYLPLPQDDPKQRRPDLTKIRSELKWDYKVSVFEGLKKTIQYFRERI